MRSILGQSIYPKITYQAYVSHDGILQSMAVGFTRDIIKSCIVDNKMVRHTGKDQFGQAEFFAVGWNQMIRNGHTLRTYSRNLHVIQHYENGKAFDLYKLDDNGMPYTDLQLPTPGF